MNPISSFVEWIRSLIQTFRPYFIVKPWEQAVRIWLGRETKLLGAGFYFKVPLLHTVTVYPIRTRTNYAPLQTLRSKDGRILTIGIIVKYRIADLLKVLDTLHNPEGTLVHLAQGAVSDFVVANSATDATPDALMEAVRQSVDATAYGLGDFDVMVSDCADLSQRTFRLINSDRFTAGDAIEYLGKEM